MSIPTKAHDVTALDKALNDRILAGDILGAFDEFYAPNVVMQENNTEPFVPRARTEVRGFRGENP